MLKKGAALKKIRDKVAEQFRSLSTNIVFSPLSNEIKSIVVTSCLPGEGKSTVISNLAVAMASSGKHVVIVDCDFRNPTIHEKFAISNELGLTNILIKDEEVEDIIVINTSVTDLYVIPSGPIEVDSPELLGSEKMKAILKELTNNFDMVLIDTPPILHLSDAQILSSLSQGTIIVTSCGLLEKNALLSAKEKIEKVGGKILGVVINKIPDIYNSK